MKTFKILLSEPIFPTGREILESAPDVDVCGPYPTRQALLEVAAGCDALIVRSNTLVDQELLQAARRLKVVARAGAQLDHVDLDEATRRGILVINVPSANIYAVAEHTFALLLAVARNLPAAAAAMRTGDWSSHEQLGLQLYGKYLGIVGFGRLGREVAARAQAFGMHVLVYDPYTDLASAHAQGVEIVNFGELLARSDILSLHTAYTQQTRHILNHEAFEQLKPGAIFINSTHAGLVDEQALLDALESGQVSAAALDTLAQEPPLPGHPLVGHPRVLALPHLNQNTVESQEATTRQVVNDVLAALRQEDYRNVVNLPFSTDLPFLAVKPYIHLASQMGKLLGQVAEGWITRFEVELQGESLRGLVRPVAAVMLSGLLRPARGQTVNWVSAPVLAYEQKIAMAQGKGLVAPGDYPNLIACRIDWDGGQRTVAGVLFGNGEARLVQYDQFSVDAQLDGYILLLENEDIPGVIGKVGTRLGQAGVNIAQWRYGRETRGGRAVSFINIDNRVPKELLAELENEPEIHCARPLRL